MVHASGECHRLSAITASRRNRHTSAGAPPRRTKPPAARRNRHTSAGAGLAEALEVHQGSTRFEGAERGVVLMLEPEIAARAAAEQGPIVLRRVAHRPIHHVACSLDLRK